MSKIFAKIIAHSKNEFGDELVTFIGIIPRIILAELNTHRMFSRNSASSRAIPFEKMLESIKINPFIPLAWQKPHKGMQGTEYWTMETLPNGIKYVDQLNAEWLEARNLMIQQAEVIGYGGGTKQLANRLLEPFMWHTAIITTGKEGLENFFDLRCPQYQVAGKIYKSRKEARVDYNQFSKTNTVGEGDSGIAEYDSFNWFYINKGQAEIHMMAFTEACYDAYNESKPKLLKAGEWHIPYIEHIKEQFKLDGKSKIKSTLSIESIPVAALISSIMCARVSYTITGHDITEWTEQKYIDKALELANAKPLHASPFEHCAETMTKTEYKEAFAGNDFKEDGWCRNFKGFIPLRHILENNRHYK